MINTEHISYWNITVLQIQFNGIQISWKVEKDYLE